MQRERQVYLHRHHSFLPALVAVPRRVAWWSALTLAVLVTAAVSGQPLVPAAPLLGDDPGYFEVLSADATLDGGVYYLDAEIGYRLSSEARNALQSGVPLSIRLDVQLLDPRRFWFDNEHAALLQLFQLEYHALSERYLVRNVNSGDQASFASLPAALAYLGRVERLPLIDAALLEDGGSYDVRMRAVLDVEQFPGPLRLLAFWRRDWSLSSDWYRWPLQSD